MEFLYEPGRIYLRNEAGKTIAEVLFSAEGNETVNITHTFVDESLRGQGVAGKLMQAAANRLRAEHKTARLTCSYAIQWFARHPEYADVTSGD